MENAAGDRQICRSRPRSGPGLQVPDTSNSPHYVDKKLDFLVKELRWLGVAVSGIQETKWFGKDTWTVDGYTLLHSGRTTLPDEGDPQERNEGVGILLDRHATVAWKNAGESWEAVSSQMVTARLKVVGRGQRQPGDFRETSSTHMTVVSAYVPTAKAPLGVKAKFIDELQDALDRVPSRDILVVLGDFNARVGKREGESDMWSEVRGRHGVGSCNEARERFLEFCAVSAWPYHHEHMV